jgi:hypothetical protein
MQWQAVSCSSPGTYHIDQHIPCQDAAKYETDSGNQIIIGAVSDGMGSARQSHIGSRLAVDTVISELKGMISSQDQLENDEEQLREIFLSILRRVQDALKNKAKEEGYSVEDLGCTLLAFVATPNRLAAMQVGDGQIVVRLKGGNYDLLFMPHKGKYPNETTPVTSSYALKVMKFYLKSGCYEFICAATDGIENISLVKTEIWKPFEGFFKPLEEQIMLSANTLADKEKEIEHFLNSERINKNTDDDKTLLLCVYSDFTNVQNTVYQNKLEPETAKQSSTIPETVQPSTDNTVSQHEQKKDEFILAKITAITDRIHRIFENGAAYDINPEIKIERSCLVCALISDHSLNDKDMLSHIVHKAVIDSQILSRIKIKKIEVYNFTKDRKTLYWVEKINVPNKFLERATVITIAAGMTLVFGLMKTFLPGTVGVIIFFIFSLALISYIWFPRVRRD